MTLLDTKVRATKLITDSGIEPAQPIKTAALSQFNYDTAEEFSEFLKNLKPNQTFTYGDTKLSNLSETNRRTKENFSQINNPWIAFDGDYIINGQYLTIENLIKLDPQLSVAQYVEHNSSSNIIVNGKSKNSHRKKFWFKFNTTSQKEIEQYIKILQKKAVILNFSQYFISPSPKSYAIYLRHIFDHQVFSPERIWYEAAPINKSKSIIHNTYTQSHPQQGENINPLALTLSDGEELLYQSILATLKEKILPIQQEKKAKVLSQYPDLREYINDTEKGILTSHLITNTYKEIDIIDIIQAVIDKDKDQLHSLTSNSYRDPFDPEYGESKAKLFINEDTQSIYLSSFAHGSHAYRIVLPLLYITELDLSIPDKPKRGHNPLTPQQKTKAIKTLEKVAPYLYIQNSYDVSIFVDLFKHIATTKTLTQLIETKAIHSKQVTIDFIAPMEQYALYTAKDAPFVTFDQKEGLSFIKRSAMEEAIMENKIPNISGKEIVQRFLRDPDRKEVSGWGLYATPQHRKLNLWAGFTTTQLHTVPELIPYNEVTSDHNLINYDTLEPILYHIKLFTQTEREYNYFLDIVADIIQQPLRTQGMRVGVAIKGAKRIGKSKMSSFIDSFFSPVNTALITEADELFTRFNVFLSYKVFIRLEELTFAHTSLKSGIDKLKALISENRMKVEAKNIDSTDVPNHIHLFLTTNHEIRSILEDSDDLRWTIFSMNPKHKEDKVYFGKLQDWWDEKGKQMFFTYLSNREYNEHDVYTALITQTHKEERIAGFYNVDAWLFWYLKTSTKQATVTTSQLHDSYLSYLEMNEPNTSPMQLKKFGLYLNTLGIFKKVNNERIYNPEKDREIFTERFFQGEYDWDTKEEITHSVPDSGHTNTIELD